MKRLLLAMLVMGLATGASRADWGGRAAPVAGPQGAGAAPQLGGPDTLLGMGGPSNGASADPYGLHPRIKRMFRLGGSSGGPSYAQRGYGQQGPAYNPNGYPPGANAPAQGTLVFPNHPFVRSPRDYFMHDLNK